MLTVGQFSSANDRDGSCAPFHEWFEEAVMPIIQRFHALKDRDDFFSGAGAPEYMRKG